ncbi:GntR family transcriptional regulator [Kribbella sp. CA-294648]|uniref:GntR family transcriptional regulator n=1 Tax=Kribbella sp. CA-294648 TaxID=3239948 RepID=UPI003D8CB5CE
MTDRVRRASGGQVVYAELKQRILSLDLPPGRRLFEPELSQQLQVSRTPLREALRLLLAEDLLEQLPTGGMVVRSLSAEEIEELYSVRAVLEGLLTAEAATRITDESAEALKRLVARNQRLVEFADDAMNAGHDFHLKIAEIADHTWAARLHHQIDGQMARYRAFTNQTQSRRTAAFQEHEAILEALLTGNPTQARALAEAHVLAARTTALNTIADRLP